MKTTTKPQSKRLYSLDALRGFDMFWIMGGEGIMIGLASLTGWPVFKWCAEQLEHVGWLFLYILYRKKIFLKI